MSKRGNPVLIFFKFFYIVSFMVIFHSYSSGDYIQEPDEKFNARFTPLLIEDVSFIIDPSYSADEKNKKRGLRGDKGITYYPNNPPKFGLDISYDNFGFYLKKDYSVLAEDIRKYGKTDYSDYRFYYVSRIFSIELYYQRYKGFYIYEPEKLYEDWDKNSPNPQRPDLTVSNHGVNLMYMLNHEKFSYPASFNQSEVQKKSAGSMLLGLSYNYLKVNSGSSLIPDNVKAYYLDDATFRKGTFQGINLSAGYAYTLTFYDFFMTPYILIGFGPQFINYYNDYKYISEVKFKSLSKFILNLSAGYNARRNFFVTRMYFDMNVYETGNIEVTSMAASWEFVFGMRF